MSNQAIEKRRRLRAVAEGMRPDRPPVSAWGHCFDRELNARDLADATVSFQREYDWDFVKVHARASYHVEGWGFRFEPSKDRAQGHVCVDHPIKRGEDWGNIAPLAITLDPFAEQIDLIRTVRSQLGREIPLIMTVFSPLDVAEKLIDRDTQRMQRDIQEHADALKVGIEAIADTFHRWVQKLCQEGVDGIYFSTKWANDGRLPAAVYQEIVRPADLHVLSAATPLWCNIVHLCEGDVQLSSMADYPVQVFHWDQNARGNPSLAAGCKSLGRAVSGGVDAHALINATASEVEARARAACQSVEGGAMILGPGCSVQMAKTPAANLRALRKAVEPVSAQ